MAKKSTGKYEKPTEDEAKQKMKDIRKLWK